MYKRINMIKCDQRIIRVTNKLIQKYINKSYLFHEVFSKHLIKFE